jgi:tetratricopeptide (TPR) repeat protein
VFHGHTEFVQAVAFAPDGRELASGSVDGSMKVWDRRTSLPIVFDGHTGWVGRLWYRRDGSRVVTAPIGYQVEGEYTKGWDPSTGQPDPTLNGIEPGKLGDEYRPPASFPNGGPPPPVTSPDGKRIARAWTGAGGIQLSDRSKEYAKSSVLVVDAATGEVLHTLIGHTGDLIGITFSPDGSRIATASFDRTVKLWDTLTGREVFTLRGHTAGVLALAFSPDGHRIVSGSIDYTARVWDATPLPAEVLRAQDADYRRKRETLGELARTTEDTQRAENLARDGRWDRAAAAFGKLVEQEPDNYGLRHPHIRSLVKAGDEAGVRRACEDLLKRYGISPDLTKVKDVVWSCVLALGAVADREAPVRLAESYLALHPEEKGTERSDALRILGAALYRAGRFEEAIRRLVESNQARDDRGDPKGFAFLAMTHHRLGHSDEAGRWLDKLVAYRPKEGADFFWDEVDIRILRPEAEALIRGGQPAAPTSAPAAPTEKAISDPRVKP